jgi:hypothetical protein
VGVVSQFRLECTGEQLRCPLVPYGRKYPPVHKLLNIVVRYPILIVSREIAIVDVREDVIMTQSTRVG